MHAILLSLSLALGADSSPPIKPTLAVLYFDNQTNDANLDVMRKGLADMMVTDLVSWDGVTVVERDKFESVVGELKLQRSKYFDAASVVKIGKFLEARYLLTGTMTLSKDKLILDARLIDAAESKNVVTARADGPKDDVFAVEQSLVEQVANGIDLKLKNDGSRRRAKVPSLDALLDYSKAIDLTDQGKVEEAQKAFAALVSKSPAFLMARERKEQAVKALEDYNKRKSEMVGVSALRVAKAADEAIKRENDFAKLSTSEQATLLSLRTVKGRFLGRVLHQYLSNRERSLQVVLEPKRQQALQGMRLLFLNHRRKVDELAMYGRVSGRDIGTVSPDVTNDVLDARLGSMEFGSEEFAFDELIRFVFLGRVDEGMEADNREKKGYVVAPTWADLSPSDAQALWKEIDARIERQMKRSAAASAAERDSVARDAILAMERKAELLTRLHRDDDAVGAWQAILDAFPTDSRNTWREKEIKKLIGGEHDFERDRRERWQKGLKTCEDMDLRVGSGGAADELVKHQGLAGIDNFWATVSKACPPTAKTRGALASISKDLAMDAARYGDCELSTKYWLIYVEMGGSVGDMISYNKNYVPWCEYRDVTRNVLWMRFIMDGGWTPEVDERLVSVKSNDGKQLAISGHNKNNSIDLCLYLVPEGTAWKCRDATWRTRDGDQVTGTCTAKLTKEAADKGDLDEGSFSATFTFQQDGHGLKTELTKGTFRVRRQ